jgi:hypothetical protein
MSDESSLTSPEGVLMLCIAACLDGFGFVLAIFGTWFAIDDYGVLDIFGILIIGGWFLIRGLGTSSIKDKVKKTLKRFIGASVVEIIPIIGGLSPSWTWLVWKELGGMSGGSSGQQEESKEGQENQEKPTPGLPQKDTLPTEKK